METSTGTSSLAERLKSWRSELKGIGLTKDDRDELQAHMEDTLDELLAKGLTEDETWLVASQRIGKAKDIRKEFMKVQDGRISWFNHALFWLMLSFLGAAILAIGKEIILFLIKVGSIPIFTLTCFIILTGIALRIIYRRRAVKTDTPWGIFWVAAPMMLLSLVFSFLTSFDGPQCYNSNEIFRDNSPKSERYVRELVKQFAKTGTDNLYYTFAYFFTEKGRHYIVMNAIGKGFCGSFSLDITNSKKLEQLVKNKGMGYGGSQWEGLKFDMTADRTGPKFIFQSVEYIID